MTASYTGPSSRTSIFSLPLEMIEQILVACALTGTPGSIAAFSQTCRMFSELVYGGTDALWRELYLSTFDDPRPKMSMLRRPLESTGDELADDVGFDWRKEYQFRLRAQSMFERSSLQNLSLNLNAVSSTVTGSSLLPEECVPTRSLDESRNIEWIKQIFASGFPKPLLRRLMGPADEDPSISISEQHIMRPDWERTAAGRALYKLFLLSGFRAVSREAEQDSHPYNLRSSSSKKQEDVLSSEPKQRSLARTLARHRVYNLPYLSEDRCWGPYMPKNFLPPIFDDAQDGNGKGKEKVADHDDEDTKVADASIRKSATKKSRKAPAPPRAQVEPVMLPEETEDAEENGEESDADRATQVSMSFIRAILTNFDFYFDQHDNVAGNAEDDDDDSDGDYIPIEVEHHHHHHHHHHHRHDNTSDQEENEADDENDINGDDDDDEASLSSSSSSHRDLFLPASGPLPVYPSHPHLLFPDYAFLSAARLVVTENLRERYGDGTSGNTPMWPWFTTTSAVEATRDILVRMGVLDESDGEASSDIAAGSGSGTDMDAGSGTNGPNTNPSSSAGGGEAGGLGWGSLRMGTAPGFWQGRGTREGFIGMKDDNGKDNEKEEQKEEREFAKPWKEEQVEYVDGWDWAGAEGKWMRAVCWMDYRDLLFHNLQTTYPLAARYHQEIQETCRVFPMTLKIVGFSRAPAPLGLPGPSTAFEVPGLSNGNAHLNGNGKGKQKASEESPGTSSSSVPYDPLVYALPVIHVIGEFRGSDTDETAARRARGTIRMIGDRAVRWNLISSEVSSPDRDEWVMEGVQVGEIGSAMGVVGMWTGASHERGDPIGPSWAWKVG